MPSPNASINIFIAQKVFESQNEYTILEINDRSINANYLLWFLNQKEVKEYLEEKGIPTHFIKQLNEREQLVRKVSIIPLEMVVIWDGLIQINLFQNLHGMALALQNYIFIQKGSYGSFYSAGRWKLD